MSVRYVLAPQAALDLLEIWRYIKNQASLAIADRVESAIREKIVFSRRNPWCRSQSEGFDRRRCEIVPRLLLFDRLSASADTIASRCHSSRTACCATNPQGCNMTYAAVGCTIER